MLGAAVLTYRPPDGIDKILRALHLAGLPSEKVIVLQNPASRSETDLRVEWGEVVRLRRNVGYGAAMNIAAGTLIKGGCETLLFITQDARTDPVSILRLQAALSDPTVGAAGPVLRSIETGEVFSVGGWLNKTGEVGHSHVMDPSRPDADCDWIDGAFMAVDAKTFESLGGFRDDFFLYYEDVELCTRIRRAGKRVLVVADATAYQKVGSAGRPVLWPYLRARNGWVFTGIVAGRAGQRAHVRSLLAEQLTGLKYALGRRRLRSVLRHSASTAAIGAGTLSAILGGHGAAPSLIRRL